MKSSGWRRTAGWEAGELIPAAGHKRFISLTAARRKSADAVLCLIKVPWPLGQEYHEAGMHYHEGVVYPQWYLSWLGKLPRDPVVLGLCLQADIDRLVLRLNIAQHKERITEKLEEASEAE